MAVDLPSTKLAVRGSEGVLLLTKQANSLVADKEQSVVSPSNECRVLAFSSDGGQLAWCDGTCVQVLDLNTQTIRCTIPSPKVRNIQFSPLGTYVAVWEPYAVTKDNPAGSPNLQVWTNERVAAFVQKKVDNWCPQWSEDELLCARNVSNEVHCFDGGQPGRTIDRKLQIANLASFALSPGKPPYKIAVYVPGTKGAPSFVRLYEYPRLDPAAIVASRSFYRADTVNFFWNKRGSAMLVLTTTEVDKTGASYYGEQSLHYLSAKGEGNIVILGKKGPIYEVEWNPNSEEFCVVYGFMPSKATLFNCKCEPVYDFGTGHRNIARFNSQGNILLDVLLLLCFAGFGNLRGNMEFWDRPQLKLLSKPQASDSTLFEWCPDGAHVITATTAPRLREGNGYKLWHFSGSLLYQKDTPPRHELWEVRWCPCLPGTYPTPDTSAKPPSTADLQPKTQAKAAAYRPPALRGKPYNYKLHEQEAPQDIGGAKPAEKLSKSALKNKKKREAKLKTKTQEESVSPSRPSVAVGAERKRAQEQHDALALASQLSNRGGTQASSGSGSKEAGGSSAVTDTEKKLKNLKKKLRQIEQLKQQQAEGKVLETNQMDKIKSEQSILDEIAKLEINTSD